MNLILAEDNDLPDRNARDLDRQRIEQATQEFLARGESITDVTAPTKGDAAALTDAELVKRLVELASNASTLVEAAKTLNQPEKRCRRLAVAHRIPFRSKSFLKKRQAAK
jgi:hypothetical protein